MNSVLFLTILITLNSVPAFDLDSLLTVQRERAGIYAGDIFSPLDDPQIGQPEKEDLRFLLAYLPLGDMGIITGDDLLENVWLAQEAMATFEWGEQVSRELYLNFVLPHRVSQEPFVPGWREQFMNEIAPRVAGMTMTEAALEVNHWCHEKATFVQTTGRDQDALTTIRSGFGRCEEEMILTICALRSIGIPARQCYTPYWAHTDNNHAWVEVWADGKWHHTGGCEPKPSLDDAWFSRAAGRAMLVVSTSYGKYLGDEPVLREFGRSTLINSTGVYGETRDLVVRVLDRKRRPIDDERVVFNLFNYGGIMPAASMQTDKEGYGVLTCGKGSWIIGAGSHKFTNLSFVNGDADSVIIVENKRKLLYNISEIDYTPPPVIPSPPVNEGEQDTLFALRLAFEDSLRDASTWTIWAREAEINLKKGFNPKPDSILVQKLSGLFDLDDDKLLELLEKARGNWGAIFRFLTGYYPDKIPLKTINKESVGEFYDLDQVKMRFLLLTSLKDKDLRDFTIRILNDHFENTTLVFALADANAAGIISEMDSTEYERFRDYVIAPRINYEPSTGWRGELVAFLEDNQELQSSQKDKLLIKWLRKNIRIEENPDRLGSPQSPDNVLGLMRGTQGDVTRLYIGLCRVRGIPARFNPVSGILEIRTENEWQEIVIFPDKSGKKKASKKGELIIDCALPDSLLDKTLYLRDWAVQSWEEDHASVVDFGYKEAFGNISWPQELPVGLYCMTSGLRREDGSSPIMLKWFEVKAGKETKLELEFRERE